MKKFLLILIVLLFAMPGWAANCGTAGSTYYVSAEGATTNAGTSASPWLHSPRDANAAGNEACTLQAGDTVIYRRGDTFYDVYINLTIANVTHTSNNTFYKTSASDALPILSGAYDPAGVSWTSGGSGTYYSSAVAASPNRVVWNDTALTAAAACDNTSHTVGLSSNTYCWDATNTRIAANVGADPATGTLEISKRNNVVVFGSASNTVSNLHARVSQQTTGGLIGTNDKNAPTISGCTIKHSAGYGIYANGAGTGGNVLVSGNTIGGSVGTGRYAVYFLNLLGTNRATGNTITVGTYGIASSNTNTVTTTIDANTIHDITSAGSGIYIVSGGVSGGIFSNTIYSIAGASVGIQIVNAASNINVPIYLNTVYGVVTAINAAGASQTGHSIYSNTIGATGAGNQVTTAISAQTNPLIYLNTIRNADVGIYCASCTTGAAIYTNDIQNAYTSGASLIGIDISGGSAVNCYSNTIKNIWNGSYYGAGGSGYGIRIAGTATLIDVYKNDLGANYAGIVHTATGASNKIRQNLVYNSKVNCIDIQGTSSTAGQHVLVYNNSVLHTPEGAEVDGYTDGKGHGIVCQVSCYKAKIYNNLVYVNADPTKGPCAADGDCNGIAVVYKDANSDVYLDNNAVYPLKSGANLFLIGSEYTTLAAAITALQSVAWIRDNAGTTSNGCANCVSGDPLITSTSTPTFTLKSGSSCINTGVDMSLTTDYAGNSIIGLPDIGAYEYQPTAGIPAGLFMGRRHKHMIQ